MQWKKRDTFSFSLLNAGKQVGEMNIDYTSTSQPAACSLGNEKFIIRRTGFWKSGVEIEDAHSKKMLLNAGPKKWYSNRLEVKAFDQQLELKVWNNPLAEWSLEQERKPILAYGLSTEGAAPGVRIRAGESDVPLLYHFFLWYLFFPVAQENGGDDLPFYFLLSQ